MDKPLGHIVFDCDGTLISAQRGAGFILYPGISSLLNQLVRKNYLAYVWTGRDRLSTLSILKSLGVASYFLDFRCADDTISKPHPQGLWEMLPEIDSSQVLIIGDSYTDIEGARRFGCASIAALWADHTRRAQLEGEGADFFAVKPIDCLEIIENYFVDKILERKK